MKSPMIAYPYEDENGTLLYEKLRDPEKKFTYRRPDGSGGFIYNLNGIKPVLYRLPALIAEQRAPTSRTVFITEGEKDADNLVNLGLVATTAGSSSSWKPEFGKLFKGLPVVVCEDNDQAGKACSEKVCLSLFGHAASIRLLTFRDMTEGSDVSNWLDNGADKAKLIEKVERLPLWNGNALTTKEKPKKKSKKQDSGENYDPLEFTDVGDALRIAARHNFEIRYNHEPLKTWFCYNGVIWERDTEQKIFKIIYDSTGDLLQIAASCTDGERRKALISHAQKLSGMQKQKNVLFMLSTQPDLQITIKELDSDPWLLNTPNGTLDLKTGELRPHRREDMISRVCPTEYHIGAQSRTWNDFVETVLPDPDVRRYVQKAAGYSLTGDVSEEKIFFVYGPPATGKSTFITAIQAAIGEYSITTDFTSFLTSRLHQGGPRSDIAGLSGYRLVSSIEVEDGQHLAEGLLSLLSGGDRISARFLHHEFFEFTPTFKIWLAANNRPDVSSGESALWRRLKLIPFDKVIIKPDPTVKKILSDPVKSGPAVLAWLVEGCIAWQKEGLKPEPDAVKILTEDYRHESDPLRDFIEEYCLILKDTFTSKQELYDKYRIYCETTHEKYPFMQKNFNKRLFDRGFREARINNVRVWKNIKLAGKLL